VILSPVDDRTAYSHDYDSNFVGLRMVDEPELYAFAGTSSDTEDVYRAVLEFELPEALQGKQVLAAQLFFQVLVFAPSRSSSPSVGSPCFLSTLWLLELPKVGHHAPRWYMRSPRRTRRATGTLSASSRGPRL